MRKGPHPEVIKYVNEFEFKDEIIKIEKSKELTASTKYAQNTHKNIEVIT